MIATHDDWFEFMTRATRVRVAPALPMDWTICPLRAMPTIKCYLCEEIMRPGAPYYDAGEAVVHKHCGERIAPPKEGAAEGPK